MGITGAWDVIGQGRICHIADYAAEHFKTHGRPLRIAVDEACWRFNNLTADQIEQIRIGEAAANPLEKTILWRILRLWKLNIQLLFVHDGLRKPHKARKHGRGGGKPDDELIRELHNLFDALRVPYHRAPGEAEAECAKLQQLGIVDAVWSDDCDSFMFGCKTLIRQHKVDGKIVHNQIRVYTADMLLKDYGMDEHSFVLFAVLCGGDYDLKGLPGCGPVITKKIVHRDIGLASSLKYVSKADLPSWRESLFVTLQRFGRALEIPATFPLWKALEGYRNPAVSTDEQCRNLRALQNDGWNRAIDQPKLRVLLRQRYNFTTREFLKHLGPVFLNRALTRNVDSSFNVIYGVQLKPKRVLKKPAAGEEAPPPSEMRIIYSPADVVEIDLRNQPDDEDWAKFAAKDGTPYDPHQKIECELLECILRAGLPEEAQVIEKPSRKSKAISGSSPPKVITSTMQAQESSPVVPADTTGFELSNTAPKKRRRSAKDPSCDSAPAKRGRKSKQDDEPEEPPVSPPAAFKALDISLLERSPDAGPKSSPVRPSTSKNPPYPDSPQHAVFDVPPTRQSPHQPRRVPKFKPLATYAPRLPLYSTGVSSRAKASDTPTRTPAALPTNSSLKLDASRHSNVTPALRQAAAVPDATKNATLVKTRNHTSPTTEDNPGDVCNSETLRERRTGLLDRLMSDASITPPRSSQSRTSMREVIDLT